MEIEGHQGLIAVDYRTDFPLVNEFFEVTYLENFTVHETSITNGRAAEKIIDLVILHNHKLSEIEREKIQVIRIARKLANLKIAGVLGEMQIEYDLRVYPTAENVITEFGGIIPFEGETITQTDVVIA